MDSQKIERTQIGNISGTLGRIHKMLLENEFEKSEKETGLLINANTRLNLLLTDPAFLWLRQLSFIMTAIDEIYFQKEPLLETQFVFIKQSIEDLMLLPNDSEFYKKYIGYMGYIPDLMLEHGHLKQNLKELLPG
jgi:hypothetical protein